MSPPCRAVRARPARDVDGVDRRGLARCELGLAADGRCLGRRRVGRGRLGRRLAGRRGVGGRIGRRRLGSGLGVGLDRHLGRRRLLDRRRIGRGRLDRGFGRRRLGGDRLWRRLDDDRGHRRRDDRLGDGGRGDGRRSGVDRRGRGRRRLRRDLDDHGRSRIGAQVGLRHAGGGAARRVPVGRRRGCGLARGRHRDDVRLDDRAHLLVQGGHDHRGRHGGDDAGRGGCGDADHAGGRRGRGGLHGHHPADLADAAVAGERDDGGAEARHPHRGDDRGLVDELVGLGRPSGLVDQRPQVGIPARSVGVAQVALPDAVGGGRVELQQVGPHGVAVDGHGARTSSV